MTPFDYLLGLLSRLNEANIDYSLQSYRSDAVSIKVASPGQRWEIDVLQDGSVEVEIFRSDGVVFDDDGHIQELIRAYCE